MQSAHATHVASSNPQFIIKLFFLFQLDVQTGIDDRPVSLRILVDSYNEIMTEVCDAVHQQQVTIHMDFADAVSLLFNLEGLCCLT